MHMHISLCHPTKCNENKAWISRVRTLIFIKQSLLTFKQTFTSQITVFSNKMTALSDLTVTAASLSVYLISATGDIVVATAGLSTPVTAQPLHQSGALSLVEICRDTLLSLVEPNYAGAYYYPTLRS